MDKKKKLSLFLVFLILFSSLSTLAANVEVFTYEDFIKEVKRKTGAVFDTPKNAFDLTLPNGKVIEGRSSRMDASDYYDGVTEPYPAIKLHVSENVNLGDVVKLRDVSIPGSGNKITIHDWQIYTYDKDFNQIERIVNPRKNNPNVEYTTTHEGYVVFFLSVADNYTGVTNFINYSEHGNYRSVDRRSVPSNPNLVIEGWPFVAIKLRVLGDEMENMFIEKLELKDKETHEVIDSFERNVDNIDPFDIDKQDLIRTTEDVENAPEIDRDRDYYLEAIYKYISFKEGKFDISKPETMTEKQKELSTKIPVNRIDIGYAFDENAKLDDVYDKDGQEFSIDRAYVELTNNDRAKFRWDLEIPETTEEYIKVNIEVPWMFRNVNNIEKDDWGTVYANENIYPLKYFPQLYIIVL